MFQDLSVMHRISHWCLNFNHCSRKQYPLLWIRWNFETEIAILRGEFTFNGMRLHKYKYPSVKMNLELPPIFIVEIQFQNCKISHFVHRVTYSAVHVDCGS